MRRWMRAAIPFSILTALITGTLIVHAAETPDPDDPDYLAPEQVREITGGTLAARLRERGITVDRRTRTEDAVTAVRQGTGATLFVTTPDLADLPRITALPAGTRVVAVAPSGSALRRSGWPVTVDRTHWSTQVTEPACADKVATAAGPAAVLGTEYSPGAGGTSCYDGALVTVPVDAFTVVLVGSPDPFRDDRITEHGNAALAVGLLSTHRRVVWLDVHVRDRPVPPTPPTPPTLPPRGESPEPGASGFVPGDGPGGPGGDGPGGGEPRPGDGETGPAEGSEGDSLSQAPPNPLLSAFPPALWATLILLALVLLALAAAAARRLGTPVAEPLPSRVPANETMLGHARLYHRARARTASLDLLVTAARRRLTTHLGLPADAGIEAIAAQAGLPVRYVRDILDGDPPRSNADLVEAATLVQLLVREITEPPPDTATPGVTAPDTATPGFTAPHTATPEGEQP